MQDRWRRFVVPAAAGLLLVPAAAVASARMLTEPEEPATVEVASAAPRVAPDGTTVADPLATACGAEAQQLLADERDGALDPVAQAALDALRPICDQAGLPLPPATGAETPASPRVVHVTATGTDDDPEHDDEDEHEDEG